MSERDFAGKVAVVTGAGSGIGAACARLPAERGAQVVIGRATRWCRRRSPRSAASTSR